MHERKTHQQTPPPVPTTLCPQGRTPGPVRAPRRRQTPPRTLPPSFPWVRTTSLEEIEFVTFSHDYKLVRVV